ncbi:MAG: glycerate kinase [Rhodobacteraceae bacterium]|jgi:glycerate 2-kinase|uniref:Hydroxypyruvate reductase n=1 Tax=Salipiger profundus TaxID=1229727 RepID=A0A1U7D8Y5_9RHOB|nr:MULTISPECIES: glycerate kinase [Salipiger]APX24634.1 hydroxypyruvate reductase [Salipiger profundus]MAB06475.1 glycerate kinase [Paracoccaceae bacterium]GFZ96688.1 TtuD3 hydroxypyruvate reductase [Salipiger profundus]SFB80780.1 hydroxypyruvate reductase [Salipiger profundus]
MTDETAFLTRLFEAAVAAADPERALAQAMPEKPKGRTVVIGLGKGAAQLGAAFERLWGAPVEGVVVTRYGYAAPCRHLKVIEAAHPVPDEAGLAASDALFAAVSGLTEDDLVVALVCGGGSALLPAPPEGLTLADEQALNRALLGSGAPIGVMNAIRKHASRIKGGRLAAACAPARVVSLIVSDVPGDDPAQVASGPTVPDTVDARAALGMISAWRIELPGRILDHIRSPASAAPMPDDACFARNEVHVVASARLSLEAAARTAEAEGIPAAILSDSIEGEARDVGLVHAAVAREVAARGRPFTPPVVLLSGGETTVTLRGDGGKGGRNTEFLLAFAHAIDGIDGIHALSADTDGIDGTEDNAGAFADGTVAAALRAGGEDAMTLLGRNAAWEAFDRVGALFVPGPTGTNVNDFRAILIRSMD